MEKLHLKKPLMAMFVIPILITIMTIGTFVILAGESEEDALNQHSPISLAYKLFSEALEAATFENIHEEAEIILLLAKKYLEPAMIEWVYLQLKDPWNIDVAHLFIGWEGNGYWSHRMVSYTPIETATYFYENEANLFWFVNGGISLSILSSTNSSIVHIINFRPGLS